MERKSETGFAHADEREELLKKLKQAETEKNKLARELRTAIRRNEIYKLNFETQSGITKTVANEKSRQEMYVRLLLKSCPDIIIAFDENMEFLLSTDSISDVIDIDDASLLQGRDLDSIVERYHPAAFTPEMIASIKGMIRGHDAGQTESRLEIGTEKGKYEVNIRSFHNETGGFAGVLVILHDISELVAAKELAEQASSAKGQFLSRMSHEMRTPMNAIIGMTSIAKATQDPEKKEYCLDKIDGASKHLLGVINDILDMSKIEANKFELSCHELDFEKMLINITNVVNFRIEEKRQNLVINLDRNVPMCFVGDELRLTQVITNLLTNAVKFTPEGGTVILSAKRLPDVGGESRLRIEIADNGIGISAEQQSRLFTSFEQADGGTARKYGGTGLGLAISKRIVELMGGQIWIESELGKGAKFIFTIRYRKCASQPRPALHVAKDGIRILAVDDAPEIREYFQHVFKALDCPCDVAADGHQALELIESRRDDPYNIIFVDWIMPGLNGIELSRRIKQIYQGNAIIIMISAAEWGDIKDEATEAGVSYFVSKPLFPSTLVNTINTHLGVNPEDKRAAQSAIAEGDHDYKNHTLLIAEDVDINREIMSAILEDTGVGIDFAENGLEAVRMFGEHPGRYSMILMDIHMPEMDGYEATRRIRAMDCAQAKTTPIVAMTANVFREDIERCLESGMNDHLGKPVDTGELFKKLEQYMPKRAS